MKILNVGSGPVSMIGEVPGILLTHVDRRVYGSPVITKNMEKLDFEDNSFDLVVCINALDHTKDPRAAIEEMIRVSKKWVHIDCALIQHTTSGKTHYWDMIENGELQNETNHIRLKDEYGFEIEFIDNQGERRYNHVICRYTKP